MPDDTRQYSERAVPGTEGAFRRVWTNRYGTAPVAAPTRILPDACADVIVSSTGASWVIGPATGVDLVAHAPGVTLRGLRIHPAALNLVLGTDADALTDRRVDVTDVLSSCRARVLVDALWHDAVDATLLRQLWPNVEVAPRVSRAVAELTGETDAKVAEIAGNAGLSPRQFRRVVEQATGLTPKTLHRVGRLQRVLDLARRMPGASLATLALTAGFTDQAHLARDVRALADLTPRELLAQHR